MTDTCKHGPFSHTRNLPCPDREGTPKYLIEKMTAEMRLAGIQVHEVFVAADVFRELESDPSIRKEYSPDSETVLRMMTCNGPLRIRKQSSASP